MLLAFGVIQFFDVSKANEKITKSYKQTPPTGQRLSFTLLTKSTNGCGAEVSSE
jgi:hypothetical protein